MRYYRQKVEDIMSSEIRVAQLAQDFESGFWKAEASKGEYGNTLAFAYGNQNIDENVYQGANEVDTLLKMMTGVIKFFEPEPAPKVLSPEPPPAPITMQELLAVLNEGKIRSISCETEFNDGIFSFGFFIVTEDHRSFYFGQDVKSMNVGPMEIIDFTTGNGRHLPFDLGTGFDPNNRVDLNMNDDWENG